MRIGFAVLAIMSGLSTQGATAAAVDRSAWLAQVEQARRDYLAFVEKALNVHSRRTAPVESPEQDPTLREGDILVQDGGLMIFRRISDAGPEEGRLVPLDPAAHRRAEELQAIAGAIRAR